MAARNKGVGARRRAAHLILAHGAGAPMTSPFMERMAESVAASGVKTTRFEFDYMAARRNHDVSGAEGGGKRPPPPIARLMEEYEQLLLGLPDLSGERIWIGGKSMGGRVASLIAERLYQDKRIAGLVCMGYPFHPPRKPEKLRTAHLAGLTCPTLIVQGTRDPLGDEAECATYDLSPAITFHWLDDGDHDFHPRRASGHTQAGHITSAAEAIARFIERSSNDSNATDRT